MRSLSDALQTAGCPPARLARKRRPRQVNCLDRSFCTIFLAIAIIGTITWLAIFEHKYHPRIYRHNEEVTSPPGVPRD